MMKPNQYQSAIVEWVKTGRGHAAVSAVAGSGKTSTLVHLVAPELKGRALFVAFNKSIAGELGARLRGTPVQASTIHSAGYKAMGASGRWSRRLNVQTNKIRSIAYDVVDRLKKTGQGPAKAVAMARGPEVGTLTSFLTKAYNLKRVTLHVGDHDSLDEVLVHYDALCGTLTPTDWGPLLDEVEARSLAALAEGVIDFTDMIWVPALPETPVEVGGSFDPIPVPSYDWVLVDEAQDLNACQAHFVQKLLRPGGRMLVVGDPRQAIYGFAGADNKAFENLVETLGAKVLPLSVCYRCPTSHIAYAQEDVEHIEAAEGAAKGVLKQGLGEGLLLDEINEGDLVLCRTTAPLVSNALKAIRAGIPASVKGRDIMAGLLRMLKDAERKTRSNDLGTVIARVEQDAEKEAAKLSKKGREGSAMTLLDKAETLSIVAEHHSTIGQVESFLKSLFNDERGSVCFATIHRAKGLEAERVHLLRPDLLPHPMASQAWQVEQEINLRYVARTRAKQVLHVYG